MPDEVPTIAVEPPRTPQQMERAIKGLVTGRYEWVAFTSVNAVKAVREKFEEYGLDARAFAGIKVAAVGEQTAAALLAFGIKPDLVPERRAVGRGPARGLAAVRRRSSTRSTGCFLPRADIATETLVAGLIELGWEVDDVTAYRTVRAAPPPAPIREAIKGGGFDAVLFTSSSTVRNLVGIAGKPHAVDGDRRASARQTAKTAEEHGLRVDVLAADAVGRRRWSSALAEYGAGAARRPAVAGRRAGAAPVRRSAPPAPPQGRRERRAMAGRCAVPGRPAAPAAPHAGAARGWSRRPGCTRRDLVLPLFVKEGLDRAARRSPRCPASSSTPATRCARRPPRRSRPASAG